MNRSSKKKSFVLKRILKKILIKLNRQKTSAQASSVGYRKRSAKTRLPVIKNKKRFFVAVGLFAAVAVSLILVITLNNNSAQAAMSEDNNGTNSLIAAASMVEAVDSDILATTKPEGKISVAMPVYTSVSISQGMQASVIMSLQSRLMELEYMDIDEPDNIYDEATKTAVERFQEQSGFEATGVVDQQTFDLVMSADAVYYIISIGTENTDVQELQQRLYELGYIPIVTGYFGTDTEAAVMKFQKLNGLSEDGKVGKDTREMLYSGDAAANSYSYGEQSPEVKEYQQRLKKLGYLTTEPDGNFGDDTKAAVKRFQENSGLIADGYIGPSTKTMLMSDDAQGNALSIGAKGDDVTNVQKRLKELGYISKATGYFGSDTDNAVRSFQKNNGLSVDGKVGSNTMNKLTSDSAKKSTGSSSGTGGSSSGTGGSSSVTGPNVESFISVALSKLGSKYVKGGKGSKTFDCSGFVYWCLNQVGVKQGYMTSHTWAKCTKYTKIKSMGDMKRGDIIVYSGHVAIYAGNGVMIDASSRNGKVVKRSCTSSWCKNGFICAFRVF